MLTNKKVMKDMSCEELLNYTEVVRKERFVHYCSINMTVDQKFLSYEDLEKCAVSIETYFCNDVDADEWAEDIRIKAYGMEWYLAKELNSPAFKEFEGFIATLPKKGASHE